MVKEAKIRIDRAQIFLAPFDEFFVDIDPYIAAWLRILLEELPRHSAAAAPEIEDGLVRFKRNVESCIDRGAAGIFVVRGIRRPDPRPEFEGR